jgi:xanthine/uracil/vitamin C permease (AzgA family)
LEVWTPTPSLTRSLVPRRHRPLHARKPGRQPRENINSYFKITQRGSTISTEVKAGICTFMTMSYILLVNGQILGAGGLPVKSVVAATALTSCLASFLAGVLANVPFGVSPGMGLNAFLVFSQVLGLGATPQSALAGCMLAALIVGALASCRALNLVLSLVPDSIKLATVVGMGLLLSFIGLQTAKVVVPDAETMVTLGDLSGSLEPLLAAGGLALIAALHYRNVRGSIIVGILATALAYFAAVGGWPTQIVALPHLQRVELDYSTLFGSSGSAGGGGVRAAAAAAAALGGSPRRLLSMLSEVTASSSPSLTLASSASRATAERVKLSSKAPLSVEADADALSLPLGRRRHHHNAPAPQPPQPEPKPPKKPKTSTATQATAWSAVCAYGLVMVFDIGGAMFGLGSLAGLVRQRPDGRGGELPGATWVFLAACLGTALGAATGTTPLIIAAESAVGIKEGGRTGLVAVVVSLCFAASCFLAPLLQAIPQVATSPVLVLVGAMMMGESVHIDWGTMPTAVPAFLTIVVQPFTFSIANGIYAGVLMSAALFLLTGMAWREVRRVVFGRGGSEAGEEQGVGVGVEGRGEEEEEQEARDGCAEGGLLGGAHQQHGHQHQSLPFEEPLLTNTYDGGHHGHHHPHHHHEATQTPTPYNAPSGPPPPPLGGASSAATAPRPIGGGGTMRNGNNNNVPSSDGGSDAGDGNPSTRIPIAAGRTTSSSLRRGGGSGGGPGGQGGAAAVVVGSLSRLAESLSRPNQYERASFNMLTNTAGASGGNASGAGVLSTSASQQQEQQHSRQQH